MNRFFNLIKTGATNLMGFMGFGKPAASAPLATDSSLPTSSEPLELPVSFLRTAANKIMSLGATAKNMASGLVTGVVNTAKGVANTAKDGFNAVKKKASDMVEKVQESAVSKWVSKHISLIVTAPAAIFAFLFSATKKSNPADDAKKQTSNLDTTSVLSEAFKVEENAPRSKVEDADADVAARLQAAEVEDADADEAARLQAAENAPRSQAAENDADVAARLQAAENDADGAAELPEIDMSDRLQANADQAAVPAPAPVVHNFFAPGVSAGCQKDGMPIVGHFLG